ncbi:hypothetical protein ES703_43523 [subsurface metagenome]
MVIEMDETKKNEEIPIVPFSLLSLMLDYSVERIPPSVVVRLLEDPPIDLSDEGAIMECLGDLNIERDQDEIVPDEEARFWMVYDLLLGGACDFYGGYAKVSKVSIPGHSVYVWFWSGEYRGDEAKHKDPSYAIGKTGLEEPSQD